MTDDSDPQDWKPEDGAGYIPTEEGGSQHEYIPIEELEALADEWEEDADNPGLSDGARHNSWQRAQDLRSLIQEYRGASDE